MRNFRVPTQKLRLCGLNLAVCTHGCAAVTDDRNGSSTSCGVAVASIVTPSYFCLNRLRFETNSNIRWYVNSMSKAAPGVRFAEVDRETRETNIHVVLDLDGGTKQDISTGIGFFDHMLNLMAFHGQFDVGIEAEGDLHVDDHHTIEDVGICLGRAFREALESSGPIERYASIHLPMEEALVLVALDISGRSGIFFDVEFKREQVGGMATENVKEFFRAFSDNARFTIHVKKISGDNDHHVIEAIFKGLGRVLEQATRKAERRSGGSTSTKGRIG